MGSQQSLEFEKTKTAEEGEQDRKISGTLRTTELFLALNDIGQKIYTKKERTSMCNHLIIA